MRSVLALLRASYLTAASYRLGLLLSLASVMVSVVPLYFISGALQPVVADSIAAEGGAYFGFLMIGLGCTYILSAAVSALPGAIGASLGSGTLEALMVTRTPLSLTLAGLTAYPLLFALVRAAILVLAVAAVGAPVHWESLPVALLVVTLIVIVHLGFGLIGAALVLMFRTSGPLATAIITLSGLLGGVYYSTTVIPAWLEDLSAFVPLTYGLRALRMLLLGGAPLREVINDISALTVLTVVLFGAGAWAFGAAFRHARTTGTLSQY